MGRVIVRVPPDFKHPVDDAGELIVGGHHEVLYNIPEQRKTAFQIYENVSEGSPVSPIFGSVEELSNWVIAEGWGEELRTVLLSEGSTPSFIVKR